MLLHFPVEINLLGKAISAHFIFEAIAFFVGYRYYVYLRKDSKDLISDIDRLAIIVGAAAGGFVGSRLLGALETPTYWFHSAHPLLFFYMSKTIVGGLMGGLWGVELSKKIIRQPNSSGDLFTFPIILAMMIGRIGCFLNGVTEPTFGIETKCIFGMNLGDGVMRHPVSLYEMVFLAVLWFVLRLLQNKCTLKSGVLFQFFMIAYLIFRFLIEFIKPAVFLPVVHLSSIQIACLLGCMYYYKTIYYLVFKSQKLRTDGEKVHLL